MGTATLGWQSLNATPWTPPTTPLPPYPIVSSSST